MKVVGIVAIDWANAGWNLFQSLKRYGMDAHLINLRPRRTFSPKYGMPAWKNHNKAQELIATADVYMIFESGGTVNLLSEWKLEKKPKVMIVNSSNHYRGKKKIKEIRKGFDCLVGLTLNYPIEGIKLGLQPVDEREFTVREDYGLRREKLIAGAAPFKSGDLKKKGIDIVKSKISNLKLITGRSHQVALKGIAGCDIFTHGIYYAYGYTLIEAAMMGIPCFGSILDRDKKHVLLDGEYPVYEIGQQGEKIPEMLEFFSSQENREIYGKKMRRWAMKYHSQKACYETYKKLLEELC